MYDVIFLLPVLWQASGLLRPEGAGLALLASTLVILLISSRSGTWRIGFGVRVMTACGRGWSPAEPQSRSRWRRGVRQRVNLRRGVMKLPWANFTVRKSINVKFSPPFPDRAWLSLS
jgi:hypothetical protein